MLINESNLHSYFPPLHSLTTQNFAMDNNSTSEQMIILGDDFAQNFQTKSFRCAFCKRGFSNAQALGGHMNIHRKDRAKLREFSDENLLSLEISKSSVDHEDNLPRDPSVEEKLSSEIDRSHDDGDQTESLSCVKGKPPRGLQLFSEEAPAPPGTGESRKVEYGELDLELRLGPEPNLHAKSKP